MNLDSIGGRKFIVTASAGFCAVVLVWFEKISDDVYSVVTIATVGAYIAGNALQKRIDKS